MFTKLKKRIEEEVGDLSQLGTPLSNPFSSDRRVGGSTQGTNTPNNLGSRQSSLASLVDLHSQDEPTSPTTPNMNLTVPQPNSANRTSNSAAAARQKAQEMLEAELKKVNSEWTRKFEAMKKSYEERIQNQEADFAWKYSSKDEELEKIRTEKRKAEDLIRTMEGSYQNKMTRVQDDMDQLEGFTKQEMAKVKHLLLNTQADFQKSQSDLVESERLAKELAEENKKLKAENESILRNLDRDRLNRVKFEAEHGDTVLELKKLKEDVQNRDGKLAELQSLLDQYKMQIQAAEEELKEARLKGSQLQQSSNDEVKLFEQKMHELEETLQCEKLKVSSTAADLEKIRSDFAGKESEVKELLEENKKLKAQYESVLQTGDCDKQSLAIIEAERAGILAELEKLRDGINSRDIALAELQASRDEYKNQAESWESELKQTRLSLEASLQQHANAESFMQRICLLEEELREAKCQEQTARKEADQAKACVQAELEKAEHIRVETVTFAKRINELEELITIEHNKALTAQADVQRLESDLSEKAIRMEELAEENKQLRSLGESKDTRLEAENELHHRARIEAESLKERIHAVEKELTNEQNKVLSTEADLQILQSDLKEKEPLIKKLMEENKELKAEKESTLRDVECDRLNTAKLRADYSEALAELNKLKEDVQKRDATLVELQSSTDEYRSQAQSARDELKQAQLKLETEFQHRALTNAEVEAFSKTVHDLEEKLSDEANKLSVTQADIQKIQSDLKVKECLAEQLLEENEKLKAAEESNLQNLDEGRINLAKVEAERDETRAESRKLQEKIRNKDTALVELQASLDAYMEKAQSFQDELKAVRVQWAEAEQQKRTNVETESLKERIRELEAKLNDKNKALKLRQQQLQDLRKTLSREMKNNSTAAQLQPSESAEIFSKSSSQTSLNSSASPNDVQVIEEKIQPDTEPAVIPSCNSQLDASRSYSDDVNFQYLKTVIFKFVTSPDPQVTHHLTKVVSTLLHLSDEEARILEKSTDKRLLTWLGSRDHVGY